MFALVSIDRQPTESWQNNFVTSQMPMFRLPDLVNNMMTIMVYFLAGYKIYQPYDLRDVYEKVDKFDCHVVGHLQQWRWV